jgi:hypothetical protein
MARKPGPGRKPAGPYKRNTEGISLRVQPELKASLERLAKEHRRSLSQEMQVALSAWIRRYQKPHITAFLTAIGRFAEQVEKRTGQRFNENEGTAIALEFGMSRLLGKLRALHYSPDKEPAPAEIRDEEAAPQMPQETIEHYRRIGEEAAKYVVMLIGDTSSGSESTLADLQFDQDIWRNFSFKATMDWSNKLNKR